MTTTTELKTEIAILEKTLVCFSHAKRKYSHLAVRKWILDKAIEKTKEKLRILKQNFVKCAYAVDNSSVSVLPLSHKKSRYLRNQEGYHNNLNILCCYNGTTKKGYYLIVSSSQITKKDLTIMSKLTKIVDFYTDNRHRNTLNLCKTYTQEIERIFSTVKRKVYSQIRELQSWRENKLFTNISKEQLLDIYRNEFEKLNIREVNR